MIHIRELASCGEQASRFSKILCTFPLAGKPAYLARDTVH